MSERRKHVAEIKRLLHERKLAFQSISHFLQIKGIHPNIAQNIAESFTQKEWEVDSLIKLIINRLDLLQPFPLKKKYLAIVGPPGVGKTETVRKLTLYYKDASDCPTILDTTLTGSPYFSENIDALGETLSSFQGQIDILLALSATSKEVDLLGMIHQFSSLSLSGLILTKCDETLTLGSLLNILPKIDFPFYFFTTTSQIHPANPEEIARKMLMNFNQEELQSIRQFAISN